MKSCMCCKHAVVLGKDIPGDMFDPPEYAEFEQCGFADDIIDIEKYFELMRSYFKISSIPETDFTRAKYCPAYEEPENC